MDVTSLLFIYLSLVVSSFSSNLLRPNPCFKGPNGVGQIFCSLGCRRICGAKWPISINIWNIWAWNIVWEIYREIPLFVELELGELEYPIFLFQRGSWRWHLNLKNTLGTRAHEARVLLSHYPTLKTIFYIFYPQQSTAYPTHNRAIHTHRPNLSISLSPSHSASQSRYHSTQID